MNKLFKSKLVIDYLEKSDARKFNRDIKIYDDVITMDGETYSNLNEKDIKMTQDGKKIKDYHLRQFMQQDSELLVLLDSYDDFFNKTNINREIRELILLVICRVFNEEKISINTFLNNYLREELIDIVTKTRNNLFENNENSENPVLIVMLTSKIIDISSELFKQTLNDNNNNNNDAL